MWLDATGRVRRIGLLSAVAAGLFVPYALLKGALTDAIVTNGWQVASLSADSTALLVHLAEEPLVLLIAGGFLALHTRLGGGDTVRSLGLAVGLLGVGATVVLHVGEHLLEAGTGAAFLGLQHPFLWGYYLGWAILFAGLGVYGLGIGRDRTAPRWVWLLLVALPFVAAATAAAAVLGNVFTAAGVFRVLLGGGWLLVGGWLWSNPSRTTTARGRESLASGTDNP